MADHASLLASRAAGALGTDSHHNGIVKAFCAGFSRSVAWACGDVGYPWRSSAHHLRVVLAGLLALAAIAIIGG